jgi:hypothetical protein
MEWIDMPLISAKFIVEIQPPCLLSWPENEIPSINAEIFGFSVSIKLRTSENRWKHKKTDDIHWTTPLANLEIVVSRNEDQPPPDIIEASDGTRNMSVRGEYFFSLLPDYKAAAVEATNRILRFFKYGLSTPLVTEITPRDHNFNNPVWIDSQGTELRSGFLMFVSGGAPAGLDEMGTKQLTPSNLRELQSFVTTPTEPSLALTFFSDSQTAWFDGNLRRSVMELAICTEIMVKRLFFVQASPAGAAFDYLEDKARISVRVLELLDAIAEEAFAQSYKKQKPANYQQIDYMFRCRNKIAHRGELMFRDDAGSTISVDAECVKVWWHAVADLKSWLEELSERRLG